MGKLTRSQARRHEQACALLEKDTLTFDEKWFVLENWHEGASHLNTANGAFFTPVDLACDVQLEIDGSKVIDLCAGIGVLSLMHHHRQLGELCQGLGCTWPRETGAAMSP